MVNETEINIGNIKIANDVVAMIAGMAAMEVQGIAGMSGGVKDGIIEILGRKNFNKGIKVEVGNVEAAVDLFLIVQYGSNIVEVCKAVQRKVKEKIESMTGLKVVEVNVNVQGISLEEDEKPDGKPKRVQ